MPAGFLVGRWALAQYSHPFVMNHMISEGPDIVVSGDRSPTVTLQCLLITCCIPQAGLMMHGRWELDEERLATCMELTVQLVEDSLETESQDITEGMKKLHNQSSTQFPYLQN